jgi:8-oxo-dGTP diphosphatase
VQTVVLVGLVNRQGRMLMQERDEFAPIEPDKWSLIGGGVEEGETPEAAARREVAEETGLTCDAMRTLGRHELPCHLHGHDIVDLFMAHTTATDDEVVCGEGRQIVFVDVATAAALDLTEMSRQLMPLLLAQDLNSANS